MKLCRMSPSIPTTTRARAVNYYLQRSRQVCRHNCSLLPGSSSTLRKDDLHSVHQSHPRPVPATDERNSRPISVSCPISSPILSRREGTQTGRELRLMNGLSFFLSRPCPISKFPMGQDGKLGQDGSGTDERSAKEHMTAFSAMGPWRSQVHCTVAFVAIFQDFIHCS